MFVNFDSIEEANIKSLFGNLDQNLRFLEQNFSVTITCRDNSFKIDGEEKAVQSAVSFLNSLGQLSSSGVTLNQEEFRSAVRVFQEDRSEGLHEIFAQRIELNFARKNVSPKTITQKRYLKLVDRYDLVIAIGPAGTGKTYLAVAKAVSALQSHIVEKIILTRPAVEAGEKLGFLPGDVIEKVNPYLRPLYDALFDIVDREKTLKLIERGTIEIAPLAYMRGRTLNNSFIIMDEAQNTSPEQMKMFLTRLGPSSKAVVTGDITQVDLPTGKTSGLIQAQKILSPVKEIKFIYFSEKDVVRHKLVRDIIQAYQKYEDRKHFK
ncbi:PhoH family protein [candidate division CSSED10-310 bacterium]|uniref:PhoH-like protein n=1 Tax=candidate division CSSED10-310 bacterium TaxID=2855610 RepID=A0ABV6YTN8_UNCC1